MTEMRAAMRRRRRREGKEKGREKKEAKGGVGEGGGGEREEEGKGKVRWGDLGGGKKGMTSDVSEREPPSLFEGERRNEEMAKASRRGMRSERQETTKNERGGEEGR